METTTEQGPIEAPGSVFLSYHRSSAEVRRWVVDVFEPLLRSALSHDAGILGDRTVFRDERSIEPGMAWPDELEAALRTSRVLVAVGSPEYFTRRWCLAELENMVSRSKRCRYECIVPVRFSDGIHYPPAYQTLQWEDLTMFNHVNSHRRASQTFRNKVRELANLIGERIRNAREDPDWCFTAPAQPDLPVLGRPRI